ncbi:MAG TPA: CBS domain-containing protein, partial [Herpetosiphonaceae bacterium]
RRVPVVENDRLVGIITSGDVRSAMPSDATSLSIYEMAYMLEEVTAAEVMRTHVITISASASIAEAAQRMLDHKISGLPVIDRRQLVGIISESDIFRAIVDGLLTAPQIPPVADSAPM